MARVRAKVVVFLDNALRQAGSEFDYDGPPNKHLEYLDGAPQVVLATEPSKPVTKEAAPVATKRKWTRRTKPTAQPDTV